MVAYYSDVLLVWTPLLLAFGLELEGRTTPCLHVCGHWGGANHVFYMCKRWWQASLVVFCVLSSVTEDNDKLKGSSLSCGFFFWVAENDDKPFDSSSSYGFFLGLKKMTTSLPTHRHLVVFSFGYKRWQQIAKLIIDLFFLSCKNNHEPFGSLSCCASFFLSCKKQ